MMKQEFEDLLGMKVSVDEYSFIEMVYTYYPSIDNVNGKRQIADLYKHYGMRIIEDMLPRASRVSEIAQQINFHDNKLFALREELKKL